MNGNGVFEINHDDANASSPGCVLDCCFLMMSSCGASSEHSMEDKQMSLTHNGLLCFLTTFHKFAECFLGQGEGVSLFLILNVKL